jgi:hypothetical protein
MVILPSLAKNYFQIFLLPYALWHLESILISDCFEYVCCAFASTDKLNAKLVYICVYSFVCNFDNCDSNAHFIGSSLSQWYSFSFFLVLAY